MLVDKIDHLRPIKSTNHPYNIVPNAPPMHIEELVHEASAKLSGPDGRGPSGDFRIGKLADGHPMEIAYVSVAKFALNPKINVKSQDENNF